jgi:hypothetical protein
MFGLSVRVSEWDVPFGAGPCLGSCSVEQVRHWLDLTDQPHTAQNKDLGMLKKGELDVLVATPGRLL